MIKILAADDSEFFRKMYADALGKAGFEVETAVDGKEAVEKAIALKPALVLMDLVMPEMTGDQMLAEMRKTTWGKEIKVIVLTNMGEQEIPLGMKELGVLAVILKADMTPRQVAELVNKQLSA